MLVGGRVAEMVRVPHLGLQIAGLNPDLRGEVHRVLKFIDPDIGHFALIGYVARLDVERRSEFGAILSF